VLTKHEELPDVNSAETNSKVDNAAEHSWDDESHGEFTDYSGTEEGTHFVHVVGDFSEEDRAFIREHEDDVLDGVEGDSQSDEEQSTVSVLHSRESTVHILEEDDCEDGSDEDHEQLEVADVGHSQDVQHASLQQQTELISPRNKVLLHVTVSQGLHFRTGVCVVVLQL
jgi:hypothetical protein